MKRVNITLSIIGAAGLLFFVYAARDPANAAACTPFCILFATVFLTGYLGEQIRRK